MLWSHPTGCMYDRHSVCSIPSPSYSEVLAEERPEAELQESGIVFVICRKIEYVCTSPSPRFRVLLPTCCLPSFLHTILPDYQACELM